MKKLTASMLFCLFLLAAVSMKTEAAGNSNDEGDGPHVDYMNQHDARWGGVNVTGYGDIGETGCFPTVAAMAVNSMTGSTLTPVETGQALHDNGYYGVVRKNLLSEGTFSDGWGFVEEEYGVDVQGLDDDDIGKWLMSGGVVAASVNGIFVGKGGAHEILITKTDNKGNVFVMDPNNEEANGWYSLKSISSIGSTEWWNQHEGCSFIGIK